MKQFISKMVVLLMLPFGLPGQDLCVGYYWTEKQGKQHLDSVLQVVNSQADWQKRAALIRENILYSTDLDKLPRHRKAPEVKMGAVHEMEGYRVTNMAIEQSPGSWITGNLYEPTGHHGKLAAVLCPHGHWSNRADYGRFREDMQRRCAVLCRMGSVVFAYDMVGYGDNHQTSHEDPQSLRIQLFNSIRIVDYFMSRKDIDHKRIGITGASGGGTQTFMLTAVDDRICVSVPVVQVSAHFFGGCVCESGMPVHKTAGFQTNNVEIAACAAPRPMLVISDGDDWTKNTPEVEYPFVKKIYALFGKEERVENEHFAGEKHDYGFSKRQPMYRFMARYLKLNWNDDLVSERWFTMLDYDALSVSLRP